MRVCKDYNVQTAHKEEEIHQSEYRIEDLKKLVDAFVALGGDPEASGYISKQRLVDILFTEFDLSFDMDDLLEQLEVQNDLLDFGQFKRLFKGDVKTMKRNSSLLSVRLILMAAHIRSDAEQLEVRIEHFHREDPDAGL